MRKTFDLFEKKLMRATKKKKKITGKMFFLPPEMNLFFSECFFTS